MDNKILSEEDLYDIIVKTKDRELLALMNNKRNSSDFRFIDLNQLKSSTTSNSQLLTTTMSSKDDTFHAGSLCTTVISEDSENTDTSKNNKETIYVEKIIRSFSGLAPITEATAPETNESPNEMALSSTETTSIGFNLDGSIPASKTPSRSISKSNAVVPSSSKSNNPSRSNSVASSNNNNNRSSSRPSNIMSASKVIQRNKIAAIYSSSSEAEGHQKKQSISKMEMKRCTIKSCVAMEKFAQVDLCKSKLFEDKENFEAGLLPVEFRWMTEISERQINNSKGWASRIAEKLDINKQSNRQAMTKKYSTTSNNI